MTDYAELIKEIGCDGFVMENLPEIPGYNGSILQIDDIESVRIAKTLFSARDAIQSLQQRVSELEKALEGSYPLLIAWAGYYKHLHDLNEFEPIHKEILDACKAALSKHGESK